MAAKNSEPLEGVVREGEAYHIDEVRKRLGIGEFGLRQMRRGGLPVRRVGRRSFVLGRDLLAAIEQQGRIVE